jgi:hypothetical protein
MRNITRWTFVQLGILSGTLALWVLFITWLADRG